MILAAGPKRRPLARAGDAAFYLLLAAALAAVVVPGGGGRPRTLAGLTAMTVLSPSMQSAIPMGSVVVVRQTDPAAIRVGDDVTYIRPDNQTVTHRVVAVVEDFEGSGMRAFQLRGVDNPAPDRDMVLAANVVGEVVWHSAGLGRVVRFTAANWLAVLAAAALLAGLAFAVKLLAASQAPDAESRPGRSGFRCAGAGQHRARPAAPQLNINSIFVRS